MRYLTVTAAIFVITCACESEPDCVAQLQSLSPEISRETARHLFESPDSILFRHLERVPARELQAVTIGLVDSLSIRDESVFLERRSCVYPAILRAWQYRVRYVPNAPILAEMYALGRLTAAEGVRYGELRTESRRLRDEETLPLGERIRGLASIAAELEQLGISPGRDYARIARLYMQLGDLQSAMHFTRKMLDAKTSPNALCQTLGAMGFRWRQAGQIDSMTVCYDLALEIAHRYRHADQVSRMHRFYAGHYYGLGQMSIAKRFYDDGMRQCVAYGGGPCELRHRLALASFYASLGDWENVRRVVSETRALNVFVDETTAGLEERLSLVLDLLEARYHMETGDATRAAALFGRDDAAYRRIMYNEMEWVLYREFWIDGLIKNGLASDALALIDEPIQVAERLEPRSHHIAGLHLMRARACLQLGELDSCVTDLQRFEAFSPSEPDRRDDWVEYDATRVRLFLAMADTASALDAASVGIARITRILAGLDGGVQGYLWFSSHDELRMVLHDLFDGSTRLGYGVELLWSQLAGHLGANDRSQPSASGSRPLSERLETIAGRALSQFSEPGRAGVLYAETARGWYRYTVRDGVLGRTAIDASPAELQTLIRRCWDGLSAEPSSEHQPVEGASLADLHRLSRLLLPPESATSSASLRRLEVCARGVVAAIPFEALHIGKGNAYHPLILETDVSYYQPVLPRPPRDVAGAGLVFVNASCGGIVPGATDLEAASSEGARVAELLSGSIQLCGERATRSNILSQWEHHRVLYAATHIVRDPDVPFLTLLPTHAGRGDDSGETFLDMTDVRAADLRGCDLVVLSGCSSGAPYLGEHATAPGFGDAFLDSGAGAVVQTFWDVRDADAETMMTAFVLARSMENGDVATALNSVKRNVAKTSTHPFYWAAFYAKAGRR